MSSPGFTFEYRTVAALPRLAWLAEVDRRAGVVRVTCGERVETTPGFFVEGVWDGPFGAGGLAATDTVFGSGAALDGEAVVFVPSCATTDWLHYTVQDGRVAVSNSLALLLAHRDDALDLAVTVQDRVDQSICDGIHNYIREVPTAAGSVRRLLYRNLRITRAAVEEIDKPATPAFAGYDDYAGYLDGACARLAANARDGGRRHALPIYSTQSKGYDSTAVNALMKPYGIDAVFTVTRGKGRGRFATDDAAEDVDDDGTEICRLLGLPVVQIDRRSFEAGFADEYLFHAGISLCQDANLLAIGRHVADIGLLLTGVLGEIWYSEVGSRPYRHMLNDGLWRGDLSGHGLGEVRLKMGLVQVAVPFIGARRRADIHRINLGDELAPWRLPVAYDRPVPRRLGEEAGLPRESFGMRKMASVTQFPEPPVPWGRDLAAGYFAALRAAGLTPAWYPHMVGAIQRINGRILFDATYGFRAVYYAERIARALGATTWSVPTLFRHLNGTLHAYCVNLRRDDYRAILAAARAADPAAARASAA
ncbi:MAG: hypothetical protein AB7K86_02685 [Rhodospirillales bacterium]